MPGGDRTGPMGQGPLTGRRMGYCADQDNPGFMHNFGFGFRRGRGMRFGFGQGYQSYWRNISSARPSRIVKEDSDELQKIRSDVSGLKTKLNDLLARLEQLTSKQDIQKNNKSS